MLGGNQKSFNEKAKFKIKKNMKKIYFLGLLCLIFSTCDFSKQKPEVVVKKSFFSNFIKNYDCPSYTWFYNDKIGARICNVEFIKNVVVIQATFLNKSDNDIEIGMGFDSNSLLYMPYDESEYKRYKNKEPIFTDLANFGIIIKPKEEVSGYFFGTLKDSSCEEYYKVIKKGSYFSIGCSRFGSLIFNKLP